MAAEDRNVPPEVVTVPEPFSGGLRRLVLGAPFGRTFAALRHRNFRLFFAGQLLSLIGTWMQNTAQGWLVYQLTGSKVLLGVISAVGSAPLLFLSIWGGSVADRHSKRLIVLVTQTSAMILAFLMFFLVWTQTVQPWHILVIAGLGGVMMAFDMPARQAFMVEMTSRDDLMNAISLNSSVVNGARVLGPSIAGFLMARVGLSWCFFLNAISFVAVIAGLLMMRLPKFVPPPRVDSGWAHALEAFHYVLGDYRMRTILLLLGIVGIFGWSYAVMMPAFATEILHVSENRYGLLLSANGIGALLGALTVASVGHKVNRRWLVFGGLYVFSGALLMLSLIQSFFMAMILLAIAGWGMLLFFSMTNTLLQTSASDAMRGRVMGIWALVFGGMTPLGSLEAGFLSQWIGIRPALASGAAVCAFSSLLVWLAVRRRDRRVRR